jgi:hypothetical protein
VEWISLDKFRKPHLYAQITQFFADFQKIICAGIRSAERFGRIAKKALSQLTVGSNPIALKSDVHAETRRTRRYNLPTNWLQAHADKLMPTRPIMNIAC